MKMTNHIKIIGLKNLKIEENLGKFYEKGKEQSGLKLSRRDSPELSLLLGPNDCAFSRNGH